MTQKPRTTEQEIVEGHAQVLDVRSMTTPGGHRFVGLILKSPDFDVELFLSFNLDDGLKLYGELGTALRVAQGKIAETN